jgi:hypothetical protein
MAPMLVSAAPGTGMSGQSHSAGDEQIVVSAIDGRACRDLLGADGLLDDARRHERRFIVFGEVHGTQEIPALFGDFVCHAVKGGPVNVILEHPVSGQGGLDLFLRAPPGSSDALTRLPEWHGRLQDGRTSIAMLRLLTYLKRLTRTFPELQIFFAQPPGFPNLIRQDYFELDEAYQWARIADARPEALNVVLVGDDAAATVRNSGLRFLPAAAHLPPDEVIALRPELLGGQAWNCTMPALQCGPHEVAGRGMKPRFVGTLASSPDGFGGTYSVGRPYSYSPPLFDASDDRN